MTQHNFNLSARIQGKDAECGRLTGLVIYPEERLVSDLIVKQGFLTTHQRVVPISTVERALEEDVYLSIDSEALKQYPVYQVKEYEEPITELKQQATNRAIPYGAYGAAEPTVPTRIQKIHQGIASNQLVIEQEMPVTNLDGKLGKVVRVVVNRERNELSYLVIQRGLVFHEQLIIPAPMIDNVFEDEIYVSGGNEVLSDLLSYKDIVRSDA